MLSPVFAPNLGQAVKLCDPTKFDVLGDSRVDQMTVAGGSARIGWSANHFLTQANVLAGHKYKIGVIGGTSGYRSDQFATTWLPSCLTSTSGWLIISYPAVNDISQSLSGYTIPTTSIVNPGVSVTSTNVAQIVASNISQISQMALAAGKKVIICLEPGSQSFNAQQVTMVHELNLRLRGYSETTAGVMIFDANPVLWNATSSNTLIVFKTSPYTYVYQSDGTHYTEIGGYYQGKAFNTAFGSLVPNTDIGPTSINDVQNTNPRQLIPNALFANTTGGSHSGNLVITSGSIPASTSLYSASNTTSVVITSAADSNGYGNDVTFACTFGGTDTIQFQWTAPSNSLWTLNDNMEAGCDISVANNSSNTSVYISLVYNYNINITSSTTATSGTGTTATVTFSNTAVATVGSNVVISGVTPTGYNGTYTVTASSAGSVSYSCTATGSQTVAGTATIVNNTSFTSYDGFVTSSGIESGPGPQEAYQKRFRTKQANWLNNNGVATGAISQGYIAFYLFVQSFGAGSMTLTISRPTFERRF